MTREKRKARRKFSEKDVIRTLIHQGVEIRCHRTKELVMLETVKDLQREHLHERELDGPDEPGNCRYSFSKPHAIITNGTKATSAGSSKHRIAKANRIEREEKFVVLKKAPNPPPPDPEHKPKTPPAPPKPWPARKMPKRADPWGRDYLARKAGTS